jgi:membrane-associated phospholipid phosphatase
MILFMSDLNCNNNTRRINRLIFFLLLFAIQPCFSKQDTEPAIQPLETDTVQNCQAPKIYIPPAHYKLNPKELIIPTGLIALSAIATNTEKFRDILPIKRSNPQVQSTPFDDVFQYATTPALFIFDAIGKEKHHPVDQFFVTALSYGIMFAPTQYLKSHYNSPRPDGENHSFPSGHTAVAFIGAHVIYKEFKDSNPWIAYSGYAMGLVVAGARVTHDKHWVADVMAGAGIAMLSTELAYLIYFPVRNLIAGEVNKFFGEHVNISPVAYPNALGLNLSVQF